MLLKKLVAFPLLTFCFVSSCFGLTDTRQWSDASGHYQFNANLIAYDEEHVVLEREDKQLISMATKDLSDADKEYLKSKQAQEQTSDSADASRVWTMKKGLKVQGKVVDFGERELKLQRHLRGKVYANDRAYENLPPIYQAMIPSIISHFEKLEIADGEAVDAWLKQQPGSRKTYKCQGVMLELPSGDRYGVPFFLFSDADRETLEKGWKRWTAAKDDEEQQEKEAFYLRAQAQANADAIQEMRDIAVVNLQLQSYNTGLFDLWEVTLLPAGGYGRPMTVVVPGRDSRQATQNALQKYPSARVGPVAKVRNRNRRRF